jgi:hypothetical protein
VAFVAGVDGRQVVVLDGEEYSPCGPEWIVSWPLCFSEERAGIACRLTSRKTQKCCIAVDGRRGAEFDRVGPPVLSRDGTHVAYRAQAGDRSFVVIDGERGPDCEFMSDPAISADGTVVAYGVKQDGRWSLSVGARRTPIDHQPSYVFLSSDGRSVGYRHDAGGSKLRVVVDGKPQEAFSMVGLPVFSPDGKTVTYAADDGDKQYIVIGDLKVEVSGRVGDPVFSPDGRKVGYGARIGHELRWIVLDLP